MSPTSGASSSPSPRRRRSPRRRTPSPSRRRSPSPKRHRRDSPSWRRSPSPGEKKVKKEPMDLLRTRAGGAYIPPAKLKMMQEQIVDKGGEQYQRMNWERLKKRIHGQVNKVNVGNLVSVVRELLQENIIRGKGLLARSIIQAQAFSPTFSHVYAALVTVINSKFPHIGELILRRLIVQFKRSFRRNDKNNTITLSKFIAHLINQQVAHELLALEIMILLLETPTDDSVEVTIAFLKECGAKLSEVSPRGVNSIFDRLRSILNDAEIDKRVQYTIEVIFHVRKDKFQAYPSVLSELDLIDEDDQITHTISLDDAQDPENQLNVFKFDPEFEKNEAIYEEIRQEIIGDAGSSSDEEGEEDAENDETAAAGGATQQILDNTEQSLVAFRRIVYLTIQSSLDYQEAAHKLLKMELNPQLETELCNMIVDCCAQQRTYEKFYGLLAERFCRLRKEFQDCFERIARDTYNTIHRFEITKLRNMARLIAHLLFTDAISWEVLSEIRLNEDDTTSSGRIYIKTVFLELVEFLGLIKLYERIRDPLMQSAFDKIFPRDNPRDTRFAINFFTSIGLGGLTIDLREHLKVSGGLQQKPLKDEVSSSSESSSDDSSSSSDSDSDDSADDAAEQIEEPPARSHREMNKENQRFQGQRIKQEAISPVHSPQRRSPPRRHRNESPNPAFRRRSPPRRHDDSPTRRRRSPSPRRGSPSAFRRRSPPKRQYADRRSSPKRSSPHRQSSPDRRSPPKRQSSPDRQSPPHRQSSPDRRRRRRSLSPSGREKHQRDRE